MGQGYSAIHPSAGTAGVDAPELADLDFDRSLAGARFLKTVRARNKNGLVVVKIYTKPYAALSLNDRILALQAERLKLTDIPNALAYHRVLETPTAAYVARQYINSSLYDRISTNPPLEDIERRWIAFQLLCALKDCHARNVLHGDLKTDNLLLTSWNWLYLSDFSSCIKPHFLPEDNPVDFTLFYDTTSRRVCYIAPERFVSSSTSSDRSPQQEPKSSAAGQHLQWTADIFSAGCVIAELFTEKPTFTLSQLFRYRKGEYDPLPILAQDISNTHIRELVTHMIQLNPDDRYSAEEYLNFWRAKAFPAYFYDFLHQYTHLITDPYSGQKPVVGGKDNNGESDDRIDRVYFDFDKIAIALNFNEGEELYHYCADSNHRILDLALQSQIIDLADSRRVAKRRAEPSSDNGALLFSTIVTASVRSTARARSRLRACELLVALGEQVTDEARLDRLLPFAMTLLEDDTVTVKMAALRTVTHLLSLVTALSPVNAVIFPRYIFPRLQRLVASESFALHPPVRAVYAGCLASLATTAARFLELTQAFRADGFFPSADPEAEDDVAAHAAYMTSHDVARDELVRHFEAQTKVFLTDGNPAVRRAFLSSVPDLCVFFGDSLASDLILTHLNTYLNNEDWTLKCSLFKTIVGVAAFIGSNSLENFLLPLMIQALPDTEETVTEHVIRSLSSIANLGLPSRSALLSLLDILTRFTLHPNAWIREAATCFIASSTTHLSKADVRTLVEPIVAPVMKIRSAEMTEFDLLDTLKKPLPRAVLDMAKVWAGRHDKSIFWKSAKTSKVLAFDPDVVRPLILSDDVLELRLSKTAKTEEDEQWLGRLRNAGLRSEDEAGLVLLKDYIYQNSRRNAKVPSDDTTPPNDQVRSLTTMNVPLQNILFEDEVSFYDQVATDVSPDKAVPSMSLAEALNDAAKGPSRTAVDANQLEARIEDLARDDITALGFPPTSGTNAALSEARRSSSVAYSDTGNTRGDMLNLMRPGTVPRKAVAETGMDSMTVTGKLDLPSSRMTTPRLGTSGQPSPRPTFAGEPPSNDKRNSANLQPIDKFRLTHVPADVAEFGPLVDLPKSLASPNGGIASSRWKPQGHVVAVIGEHSAQVTCIAVSPDHVFFVTGSKDGTIRVWDTSRLERNVTHRSRQVHRQSGAAITSICFAERTHTFISAAVDGSINIVKVEASNTDGAVRYGKLLVLREWKIPSRDTNSVHAIRLEHYREKSISLCLILTSRCTVLALDLKSMEVAYELTNPVDHGVPTSFCLHRSRQWLVIATSHGVLDLWDLRFRLLLRSWTFPSPVAISQVSLHPSRRSVHRARICISGGTLSSHVSIWDLEKQVCTEVFDVHNLSGQKKVSARDLILVPLDSATAGLKQLSRAVDGMSMPMTESANIVRAFTVQMHARTIKDESDTSSESRWAFLVSGGPDTRLRFWDMASDRLGAYTAVILGGPGFDPNSSLSAAVKSTSAKARVSVEQTGAETRVFTENSAVVESASGTSADGTSNGSGSTPIQKMSRYDVIKSSARGLMNCHADQITCVSFLEIPFEMIVSADRSGMIYIFR